MATPCSITYEGKDYSIAEFATLLHDGLLDTLIESKDVTLAKESGFDKAIDFLENLKADNTNRLNAFGILPEIWNAAISSLQAALKAGKSVKEAMDSFIQDLKDKNAEFDEKQVRETVQGAIDKGMQTKPKVEKVETEIKEELKVEEKRKTPEGKEERRFPKQVLKNYPNLENAISDRGLYYEKLPNKVTLEEAKGIIEYLGDAESINAIKDLGNGISWATRLTMGQVMIKKLLAQNEIEAAIDVAEYVAEKGTELGQGIQALSIFDSLTPEAQIVRAKKEVSKQNKTLREKANKKVTKLTNSVNEQNASIVDEVIDSVDSKITKAETIVLQNPPRDKKYGNSNKIVTKERYENIKKQLKGKLFSNIPPELVEVAVYHMEAAGRKFSDFAEQMVKDFGNKIKPYLKTLYSQAKGKMKDDYSDFDTEEDINSQYDKIVGETLFDKEKSAESEKTEKKPSIRSIVKKHYTIPSNEPLQTKLEKQAGLSKQEAKDIAESVEREFAKKTTEQKRKILGKSFGKSKDAHKMIDELIHLSNTKAMSFDEVMNMYAEAKGFPVVTKENVKEIERLTNKVQQSPEGFKRFRAMEDLLKYQANISGVSKWDIGSSLWYANILSGYKTHLVNAASNVANSIGEYAVALARNPKTGVALFNSYWKSFWGKGMVDAGDVLRTGYSPIRGKLEVPDTLERVDFIGGKYNPANYLKYVSRAMKAEDVVFYTGLKSMRMYQLANMMAADANSEINDGIIRKASDYMNLNDAKIKEIQDTAEQEYQNEIANGVDPKQAETDKKRRIYELTEQALPSELANEASVFAARATFNYQPEGLLGWGSKVVNNASNGFPPFKFVVPFTNIIANVANEAMNWTPWGFARGFSDGSVSYKLTGKEQLRRKDWASLSEKQKQMAKTDMMIKATIGTTMMTMLYLLTQKWDDDDEPFMEITANGTGDYKKNYQLMETGWQPYSIRIGGRWYSYQNSPLLIGLSFIGNIRDYETHRKEKITDEGLLTKMSIAANNTKGVLLDMTFLKGLNTFLQNLADGKNESAIDKAISGIASTGKSFVIPNLYNQIAKDVQSIFDIPTKEVSGSILGSFLKDIPVARNLFYDKINVLGEPIVSDTDKFTSAVQDNPIFELFVDKKAYPSAPSIKTTTIVDESGKERLMNNEEFYEYSKARGEYIKERIESNLQYYSKMSPEQFQKKLASIQKKATLWAKMNIKAKKK